MTNKPSEVHSVAIKIWGLFSAPERRSAVVLLGLMIIGMMLEALGVGLVIPALALLTQGDFASKYPSLQPILQALGNPSQKTLIIYGMLGLVGLFLVKTMFLAFLAWRQTRFAFDVQVALSQRLFTVYLRQPYVFHLQRNSAQLIRNVITEVAQFTNLGIQPGMLLLTESLMLLGVCSLLLVVEPVGMLITALVLGGTALAFHGLSRTPLKRWGVARQLHEGLRIQHVQQGLGSAKDLMVLGCETEFLEQYRQHNVQSARAGQLMQTLQQLPRLWLELLAVAGLATLVLTMLAQGRSPESLLPTLGLFAVTAFRIMPSANRVLDAVQGLRYGMPVFDLLHAEIGLGVPEGHSTRGTATPFCEDLQLHQVTYGYPGANGPVLKDISLTIRRGESVGFIGPSGAGKSTLVDIVLGLLTPDSGKVGMDGNDIQGNLRNWMSQIGYVPQAIFLTDDTLRRNIAFGLPTERIDDVAVRRAIRAAQLDEFVSSMPLGLDTLVGERGVRLSGGQRQRIGIARALYHDPAVLVLDEATSSLDTATERGVLQAVEMLQGSKTIVIVAHRMSTVEHCDRLFRLDHGVLAAEGSP